ncbi:MULTISPECIES: glutamate-1-semialdehyde 2,1-aminomutase [Caloramator]|uniref:Glutamate-1-semialdehyde 2,1-aminomutase n=1 Tax=Caloramator australicus RC3 TaxID=857293 RepID=I7K8T6_9CLOT|nr:MULTISPECIES: glutamate-1-semialdehyde 2,1-aminomutase [Caloramator]MDO6353637.1 glutamate-1-semialdehyde 2,1-aminomutase [Caloramator sp. CAR-1]CCJ33950.1 Glutamate-1-semialdehyde aminotransferase [Caloramator australicus RC3]
MRNEMIFNESLKYMPGGVNSPVRAFKGLNINPPVLKKGKGQFVYDEDGKKYVDYVGAWGPMILGHCDEEVLEFVKQTLENSIAFGAPTELELKLASLVCETIGVDMIRFVNSGTEATMSAVRLARGYTNRSLIVKFMGCYHGHYDGFLVSAGSGVLTQGIPGSSGVPLDSIKNTIIAEYNDIEGIKKIFESYGDDIACVLVEPIAGNMGVVPSKREFLMELRRLCTNYGAILIFDEVMTGFRVAYKGAREIYGVEADIVTLGKIIGGGLPCGAYAGRREIMENLSPIGPVYQAGTMSGNPVVMAAGYATLKKIYDSKKSFYDRLEKTGLLLEESLRKVLNKKGLPHVINRAGSMLTVFFTTQDRVENYSHAKKCNINIYNKFAEEMIKMGNYVSPSQFEALFISIKHTEEDIEKFVEDLDKINF